MNTIAKQVPTMVDESRAVATRTTGPSNTFLVPTSMPDAMRLAEYMAASTLVPRDFQKKPADCLMVVMQAVRWQMDPFAVIQKCSVIQSKLMYEGQLVAAVVNTRGNLKQRLSFTYFGEGKERGVTVSGQFYNEDEPRTVDVLLAKVKTSAKVWDVQPDQQLGYHGCRVWARRHMPELMLGVYSEEEFDDVKADAERDIANGISIVHPEDYSDGVPEWLTKEKKAPTYSRAEQAKKHWEEKVAAFKAEIDEFMSADALINWGTTIEPKVRVMPESYRKLVRLDFGDKLYALRNRDAELAGLVVHDSDDIEPRPATMADFYEGNERATVSSSPPATGGPLAQPHQPVAARVPLSERAIAAREKQ